MIDEETNLQVTLVLISMPEIAQSACSKMRSMRPMVQKYSQVLVHSVVCFRWKIDCQGVHWYSQHRPMAWVPKSVSQATFAALEVLVFDLVNHCINDISCRARPLFLDYVALLPGTRNGCRDRDGDDGRWSGIWLRTFGRNRRNARCLR